MARGKKNANSTALTDPETRKEIFMAKAAGLIESAPSVPYTREERYWLAIIEAISQGSGGFTPEAGSGAHNAIYRGKYLGTSVTSEQYDAIGAGTFEDLFIGDYWTINDVNWRIAAFDYYYNSGSRRVKEHHAVIVPDTVLDDFPMNSLNDTSNGYGDSDMHNTGLLTSYEKINACFGENHILRHYYYLVNVVTNGIPSSVASYEDGCNLMTESNVYGSKQYGICNAGTVLPKYDEIDAIQFPLFAYRPDLKSIGVNYWLRDVASSERFTRVGATGAALTSPASTEHGVRPAFSIKK